MLNWMLVKSNGLKFKNQSIKIRMSQLVLNSFGAEYLLHFLIYDLHHIIFEYHLEACLEAWPECILPYHPP